MGRQERERFWREHVQQMLAGSQSGRVYAKAQGLSYSTLQWWKRKLRDGDRAREMTVSGGRFVELRLSQAAVSSPASKAAVTVHLGQSLRLELGELPAVPWLVALQSSLRERC